MGSFLVYVHWFLFLKVVWIDWYWQYYIGRREILMNCTYILLTSDLALRMALNCTWSYRNNCSYLQLYFYSGIFSNLIEKKNFNVFIKQPRVYVRYAIFVCVLLCPSQLSIAMLEYTLMAIFAFSNNLYTLTASTVSNKQQIIKWSSRLLHPRK